MFSDPCHPCHLNDILELRSRTLFSKLDPRALLKRKQSDCNLNCFVDFRQRVLSTGNKNHEVQLFDVCIVDMSEHSKPFIEYSRLGSIIMNDWELTPRNNFRTSQITMEYFWRFAGDT